MIIAEIGQNHCGDMGLAKELIRCAKGNGADLVKFQLYDHKKLYADHPEIPNSELSKAQAFEVFDYGTRMGIEVFFSVFDTERVKWCEEMGVKRYKIAYYMNDPEVLAAVQTTKKPIFSSNPYFIPDLYCIPKYPASITDIDFEKLKDHYGFSDHTIGLDAAKIALARGAEIIEKHFAIDHNTGIDAAWSMTPDELRELKRWEGIVKQVI